MAVERKLSRAGQGHQSGCRRLRCPDLTAVGNALYFTATEGSAARSCGSPRYACRHGNGQGHQSGCRQLQPDWSSGDRRSPLFSPVTGSTATSLAVRRDPGGTFAVSSGGVVPSVQFGAAAFHASDPERFQRGPEIGSAVAEQQRRDRRLGTERRQRDRRRQRRQSRAGPAPQGDRRFQRRRPVRHLWQNDSGEVVIWELNGTR